MMAKTSKRARGLIITCAKKLQEAFDRGWEWVTFEYLAFLLDPSKWSQLGLRERRARVADIKASRVKIRDIAHSRGLYVAILNARVRADRKGRITNVIETAEAAFYLTEFKRGCPLVGFGMCINPGGNGYLRYADSYIRKNNAKHIEAKHEEMERDAIKAAFILPGTLKKFKELEGGEAPLAKSDD